MMARPNISIFYMAFVCVSIVPLTVAAPMSDNSEEWKLTKIPDDIYNRFPMYIAANDRLLVRVPELPNRVFRVHKKFDSLSGGTFGMQKRFPYSPDSDMPYSPMS